MESEVDGILVAAHELKAPLAVLRQLAFSLGELSPGDEHIRANMVRVSERAIRQVNDLAKIRRLDDGLFEMEPLSVREVCDAVSSELLYLYRGNNCDLLVKYSNRSQLVSANRELLYSVVYNFLLNALHYSAKETRTRLTVGECGDKIKVVVRDYGPALPVEIWKEIRKGWVAKPTSIAMRPGSSGLGLYIASRFSRYMNARIGAVRHRDGTSFFIELPISKQLSLF